MLHSSLRIFPVFLVLLITLLGISCSVDGSPLEIWLENVNIDLKQLLSENSKLWFEWSVNITDYNAEQAIQSDQVLGRFVSSACLNASTFDLSDASENERRMVRLITTSNDIPPIREDNERMLLSRSIERMSTLYSTMTIADDQGKMIHLPEAEQILATSRDYNTLSHIWFRWHTAMAPARDDFIEMVRLSNIGANEIGFSDTGELWRSPFDMTPEQFEKTVDSLWEQLKPLYESLHCYTRAKLDKFYSKQEYPIAPGPIPAHLLGNMWAQDWSNIYDLLVPFPNEPSLDVNENLKSWSAMKMVQAGEAFFSSLGMGDLVEKFWEYSMIVKPPDREVVCHASAWDVASGESASDQDVRLKMCTEQTLSDLITIHHELGHIYYFMAYRSLPQLYRQGANNGFHEAIGDTIALSMTPSYLHQIGLLDQVSSSESSQINALMVRALEKVAFLPFGLLIDKWRWKVYNQSISDSELNESWWEMRYKYQGIYPAYVRTETDFDPAAKFHIVADVPYIRYFLATVLQFQFHRALCNISGFTGPLHNCSIFQNADAGNRLFDMMKLGASRPWQEALFQLTGSYKMDASAMLDYFQPLKQWLDVQNQGEMCGWDYEATSEPVPIDDYRDNFKTFVSLSIGIGCLLGLLAMVITGIIFSRWLTEREELDISSQTRSSRLPYEVHDDAEKELVGRRTSLNQQRYSLEMDDLTEL